MSDLLSRAASPVTINATWKLYQHDRAPWRVGLPKNLFEKNALYHLLILAGELSTGIYQPDRVRRFTMMKGNGEQRILSALSLRDKIAQRAILSVIEPLGEKIFHANSFAYRPARSIDMALRQSLKFIRQGQKWLICTDIEKCFDSIPHKPLLREIYSLVKDKTVVALIKRWLDAGAVDRSWFGKKGIPQGAVLSPFLCNLYLNRFDKDLDHMGISFVRYADDLLLFARTQADAHANYVKIEKILNGLGLRLNKSKTTITPFGSQIHFLGKNLSIMAKI